MYEFIDAHGERVSVRSARTLAQLLVNGRITAATRFRLADEPGFVAAGEHAALREIASQAGVPLPPASPVAAAARIRLPDVLEPMAAPPPRAAAANPWGEPAAPPTPWATAPGAPPGTPRAARQATPAARVGMVLAAYLGAVLAGLLAGAVARGLAGSSVLGWLVTVPAAPGAAWLAGRALAVRTPRPSRVQVAAGSAMFLAGCLVAGWPGVIVGVPACAVLWTGFGKPSA